MNRTMIDKVLDRFATSPLGRKLEAEQMAEDLTRRRGWAAERVRLRAAFNHQRPALLGALAAAEDAGAGARARAGGRANGPGRGRARRDEPLATAGSQRRSPGGAVAGDRGRPDPRAAVAAPRSDRGGQGRDPGRPRPVVAR